MALAGDEAILWDQKGDLYPAASFARLNEDLSDTLPGIAISVALIPPLAVVGIGAVQLSWTIVSGALGMFLLNAIGIIFASMLVFSLMNLYAERPTAAKTLKKEEKALEDEKKGEVSA